LTKGVHGPTEHSVLSHRNSVAHGTTEGKNELLYQLRRIEPDRGTSVPIPYGTANTISHKTTYEIGSWHLLVRRCGTTQNAGDVMGHRKAKPMASLPRPEWFSECNKFYGSSVICGKE